MSHKLYITKIEAVDECKDLSFHVETFDEATATVTFQIQCFTLESWKETASDVAKAIEMLGLESN